MERGLPLDALLLGALNKFYKVFFLCFLLAQRQRHAVAVPFFGKKKVLFFWPLRCFFCWALSISFLRFSLFFEYVF